jgi:transcription initiation factor IIE alpha subunit
MGIEKKIMYLGKCDKCGEYLGSDVMEECCNSKKDLIERLEEELWVREKKQWICERCILE